MSAPTPISSLVHSSTLVTAGVYLSIRFGFLIVLKEIRIFLMLISLTTILLGGSLANFEIDFKKVVAISTLRQLGILFFLVSLGFSKLCFFHMICHAFFKSLLFMGTGGIIIDGSQDSRFKGRYLINSFLINSVLLVSIFSLIAVPFRVGFYSKDLALDFIFWGNFEFLLYFSFIVGRILTIIYSLRISFYVFSYERSLFLEQRSSSFFFLLRLILGCLFTFVWGKFLFHLLIIEDFVLLSFPLKILGRFMLVVRRMFVLKKRIIFFYSFII